METSEPGLLTLAEMRGRGDTWQEIADEYSQSKGRGQVALSAGRLILGEKAAEVKAKVDQYNNLKTRVAADEASSNNPRATSAYSSVSALPTDEPMPEWTATKSGKNVQRVDVVVPQKRQNENDLISDGGKIDYDAKGKPLEKPLWQPDNLHENLPNTLGWAMIQYKTGPKGEKIAVIAEAQSRWGQQLREDKMSGDVTHPDPTVAAWHKATKTPDHPLLRDYNRLILKAAIEQARKEGATHIMVSDAETAMMTEGHDVHNGNNIRSYNTEAEAISRQEQMKRDGLEGNITKQGDKWVLQERPSQEPGMRLNYDTILPKIAEELTGSKGEKVSLGEHKNAFRDPNFPIPGEHYLARETRNPVPRSNLIFRNADGTPKTDVSGTMYPLGKAGERLAKGEPMTLTGKLYMGIPGFDPGDLNPVEVAKKVAKAIKETVDPIKELVTGDALKATWARQAGVDAPKTMTASPEAGEALVGFAASKGAGQAIAKSAVTDVLGDKRDDPQFRKQLGAVIYEDMRRAEGRIGNPVTDIANSPFADEAQYRAALKNPEIQAALQRHKDTVQEMARVQHERLGGELAKVGEDTGAFANMIAILDEPRPESKGGPGSGQFNTLTRGSAFSKPRKFSAAEYNFDYRDIGERMIEKNYSEVKKQELYDKLEATGLGKMLKQGDSVPEGFVGVPVQRRQLMITKPGEKPTWVNQNKTLAVRNDVAPEAQQAFQTDSKLVKGLVGHLADLVTKAQVQLGVDAGFHTANDFAGLNGAIRTSIGKNLIGVKEADTLVRMFKNGKRLLDDSPEVQRELAAMAKAGVGIRDNVTQSKALSGRFLRFIDTATRVSMNGLFDDMVKEGWVKDVPAERRRFINGALGQYNPRLMTKLQQIMQQSGASPFIVAGKNFNRLAVQRLMMSPGVKAASPEAFAKMRALQVLSAVSALVILPAAVNYWQTGKPEGRPGTKFGEMNVGKMNVDPAQWMMLRRGMRLTGLQAGIEGMRSGQDLATTGKQALKDVVSARLHPYEGPAVRVAEQLGKTALAGQGLDMKKAVSELNPTIGAGLKALEQGKGKVQGVGEMVGNMVGVKVAPEDRIVLMQEARIIARGHGKPDMVYSPSQYTGLINTLKNNPEKAKSVYEQLVKDEIEADKMEWDVNKKKARVEKLIEQHFKNYPTRTFTGKKEWDEELQKKQPELYQKVRAEDKATADLFFQEVLGQGGVPVNLKQKRFSMKQALEGLK